MLASILAIAAKQVSAETVFVKYRGEVSLDTFDCAPIKESSLIKRLCYDEARSYLVVQLKGTYYHYCAVDPTTVAEWRSASSLGKFYNSKIKGSQFDCRVLGVPD